MFSDTYFTLETTSNNTYKEKGSKFIAYVFPCYSEADFKQQLQSYREQYADASHHCWAFRLGFDGSATQMSDDGEPAYTAGKPIFGQLLAAQLCNVGAVVIRYFGGTLLGVGGLIKAYKEATEGAIKIGKIIEKTVFDEYFIQFDYPSTHAIMKVLKHYELPLKKPIFDTKCELYVHIPRLLVNEVVGKIQQIEGISLSFMQTLQ